MAKSVWGGLLLALASSVAHASEFDNRWYISGEVGGAFADDSEYDAGVAWGMGIGKKLYPRFTVEANLEYHELSVSVNNQTADFTRMGGAAKGLYDLIQIGQLNLASMIGLSIREIEWLGVTQSGFGGYAGLRLDTKVGAHTDLYGSLRYILDEIDAEGPLVEDTYYSWVSVVGLKYKFGVWPPPPPDADGDGIPDSRDQCPNTPIGAPVDNMGCPLDSDADGVPDYRDRCPNTPLGVLVDEYGCPIDSDADGVIDPNDKCPDTPRGVPVDAEGCPQDSDLDGVGDSADLCPATPYGAEVDVNGCPFDTDQDGVPDFRDDCPNTPYGVPVNERGCSRDNDGDGVENDRDLCPNTYPGLEVDVDGCPIRNQTLTLHNVHFEFDRADLLPDSIQLLKRVAKSLNDQPGLKLEIAGHTDALGSDQYNLKLSQERAASVRSYLISQGVMADHVFARGYGERVPVADNVSEEGRALNRRVEIHLLE